MKYQAKLDTRSTLADLEISQCGCRAPYLEIFQIEDLLIYEILYLKYQAKLDTTSTLADLGIRQC